MCVCLFVVQVQTVLENPAQFHSDALNAAVPQYPDVGVVVQCGLMAVLEAICLGRERQGICTTAVDSINYNY